MRGYAGKIAAYFLSVTLLVYAFATAWSVHSRVVEARAVLQERERTAAALRRENAALEKQLQLANEQLNDKTLRITEAGSIAQASLQVNNVFESAQKAAVQYLDNIRNLSAKQEELCAKREAASIAAVKQLILYTCEKCRMMEQDTKKRCDEMVAAAEKEVEEIREQAQKNFEEYVFSSNDIKALLEGTDSEET